MFLFCYLFGVSASVSPSSMEDKGEPYTKYMTSMDRKRGGQIKNQ